MIKFKPHEKHKHMDLLSKQKSAKLGPEKEQAGQATIVLTAKGMISADPQSRANK